MAGPSLVESLKSLKLFTAFTILSVSIISTEVHATSLGQVQLDKVDDNCTNKDDPGADPDNPHPLSLAQKKAREDKKAAAVAAAASTATRAGTDTPSTNTTPPSTGTKTDNQSAQAQLASGSDVLKNFSATNSTNSTVITSHILTALTPAWLDKDDSKNTHFYNAAGWDISAALPVNTATLQDYTKQELLGRYTGVFTLFTSFAGRNPCNYAYRWKDRAKNVNRLYLKDTLLDQSPPTPKEYLVFISQGIGIRALKTKLVNNEPAANGSTTQSTSNYTGGGMAFLGLGADGPMFDVNQTDPNAPGGLISFEVFGAAHVVNAHTLNSVLGTTNAHSVYYTLGANLLLTMPNNLYLNLEYSKPLTGFMKARQSDLTMITVGYQLPSSNGSTPNPAGGS